MKNFFHLRGFQLCLLLVVAVFGGCARKNPPLDQAAYRHEIEEWQKLRHDRLLREDGWLTLCGLSWLKEGENKVGSDSSNAVVLPSGKTPPVIGSIFLDHGALLFRAVKGAHVTLGDSLITELPLHHDQENGFSPTILHSGTVTFQPIKRGDQLGVRVKDKENPARLHFKGLDYFPINPAWRLEAKFERYNPPKVIQIASVINTVENDSCPGALVFTVGDTTYRLDAVIETGNENELFIMFGDATNGGETYGNGRQLYTSLPDSQGNVILDFNKGYNWPCVFTDFATCPIPPRQNRLPIRVDAGEKMYTEHR